LVLEICIINNTATVKETCTWSCLKSPSDDPTLVQIWQVPVSVIFLAKIIFLNIKTVPHFLDTE